MEEALNLSSDRLLDDDDDDSSDPIIIPNAVLHLNIMSTFLYAF